MTKKNIIIIIVSALIVIIVVGGYFYWKSKTNQASAVASPAISENPATNSLDAITQNASQGVLPSIGGVANPIGTSSNLNPTAQTNPFNYLKTNPFQ
ncbi:MAG: hypothetical protein M1334_02160 [Patescibacteria group bacterium]|nr:hypothetical protein [Patescibacteria group bacterium]